MISRARKHRGGFIGIGVSVSIGAFVALGCGSDKSETPPAETPAGTAEQPAAAVAVEEIWTDSLPEGFPQDVPRYPDAPVVKALTMPESGFKASFSTPDDPSKVASYFSDAFAAQGWSTQRVDAPDGTLVFADKGARSATVGIGAGEGKTKIDVMVVEMR